LCAVCRASYKVQPPPASGTRGSCPTVRFIEAKDRQKKGKASQRLPLSAKTIRQSKAQQAEDIFHSRAAIAPSLAPPPFHSLGRQLGRIYDHVVYGCHQQQGRHDFAQRVWHINDVGEGQAQEPQHATACIERAAPGGAIRHVVLHAQRGRGAHAERASDRMS